MKFADKESELRWRAGGAVNKIINDINDRNALGTAWGEIDDDIKAEIWEAWCDAITTAFRESK